MAIFKKRVKRAVKPKTETNPKVKNQKVAEEKKEVAAEVRKVTLRNEFHKTEVEITVSAKTNEAMFDKAGVERIKDKLYGDGCRMCGDALGLRGHQDFLYRLDPLENGGLKITVGD